MSAPLAQALPLEDGAWRAAAPDAEAVRAATRARGWEPIRPLPGGAWAWRPTHAPRAAGADRPAASADLPSARGRAIADALDAARAACARPLPAEPRLLGILNLTPDSFSDGGALLDAAGKVRPAAVVAAAARLRDQGAAALDLGAESTRPGAQEVPVDRQLAALLPALEAVLPLGLPCAVDTRSARVAAACLEAGAAMINDVSGLAHDADMAGLCAARDCPTILMHMRGQPATMRAHAHYQDLLGEVADELAARVQAALHAGMNRAQIVLDPGLGFAKDAAQSRALLARCGALRALGFPLLVGPSRKSFLADLAPAAQPAERDAVSIGAAAVAAAQGATWIRLHDGAGWPAVRAAAACARAARGEA